MRKNWRAVLCVGLAIVFVASLAQAQSRRARVPRSTSTQSAGSEQAKQITCTGKVVDAQGQPITDAKVKLYKLTVSPETLSYDVKLAQELATKEDGAFTIKTETSSDEFSAQAIILAQKEGLAMGWANWVLRDNLDVEIKLGQAKVLAGTVVDEAQKPIADTEVVIAFMIVGTGRESRYLMGNMLQELLTVRTNTEGRFSFGSIPAEATAEFLVKKPGRATVSTFPPENYQGRSLQFSPGQTDIKLTQPIEAKIEGMVVEKASGKPVAGIKIRVSRVRNQPNFGLKPVVSKEDGTFSANALAGGKHILKIVSPMGKLADWITEPVEVLTETGKTKSGVKMELSKGGLLEVVITEAVSKQPVEQARVSIRQQASNKYFGALSNEDGIARIRLMPGEYQMSGVYKQGYSRQRQQETITIEDGKTARIECQLVDQPKITGVVRDEKDKPVQGVKLKVCPTGGQDVSSDAEGKFEVNWDPRGWGERETTFYLVARHEQRNLAATVEIDEDTRTLDIRLRPGVTFTGKVLDPDGKGIANARILVMLRASSWGSTIARDIGQSNAEGNFEIKAIPAEHKYSITASAEGYGQNRTEVQADDAVDNQLDVGTLTLAVANLSVSGVVVDANDKPVANARISTYGEGQPYRNTQTDADGKFTIEKICAGKIRISTNISGKTRLYGSVETEGGATDVKVVISERPSTTRYVPKRPPSLVGRPLPELKDLKIEISSADVSDKMILVCFWDMEQRPSRYCIRQLAKQAEELKGKGVAVVTVQASKIDENKLNEWVKNNNIPFTVGMIQGDEEETRFTWGVKSLPWLILTDRKHIVRAEDFRLSELDEKLSAISQK
ncbi:MAG: carboxypeptidase regulatory-like domain-containing protein [Planctomycetes bacterium]|nr:carboxypeptidase regulatory-like domain-containing protein [Planctomycetota bacterium]